MSDTSDDTKERQGDQQGQQDSVCRDYVRGICERRFCKYKHENEARPLNFCHDFQNSVCPRTNCKFIHCSTDESDEYKRTGEMSDRILAEATRKNQLPGIPPVCNQYRKGMCRRNFCKYRHITKEEEDAEIMGLLQSSTNNRQRLEQSQNGVNINVSEAQAAQIIASKGIGRLEHNHFDSFNEFGPTLPSKRRFLQANDEILENNVFASDPNRTRGIFKGYFAGNPPAMLNRVDTRTIILEEEINLLHKEIAQLKRQVSDLTATNEFLLDQNATLRVSRKPNGSVSVPSVTITNTLPQNNPPPQPQPQQVIRTVTASVATVPVSLATVTTCNPVSGNPVSIAGCPTVSIASPAQILAPSQQILVTANPSPQLTLANSSTAQLAIAQQNLANNLAQAQAQQPQLTSQAQQLALATTTQQLTSQAQHIANQQLALASAPQQLTAQIANPQGQQLTVIANPNQQLLAQQNLTNGLNTSQGMAMSNATQPMVSYPIMTQSMLQH